MKILDPNQNYTFSRIFEMRIAAQDLAQELGYQFTRKWLNLTQYTGDLDRLSDLENRLNEILPYFDLSNETSRREVLISPIILDLVHYTKSEVRIEYPLKITNQLQGYLDYWIQNQQNILVIEAKKEDLDYGLTQLVAELVALDQWENMAQQTEILGAITTGKIWEFCKLYRLTKSIEQGLNSYRVPEDLDTLMRILVHSLIT
ncbi:MAG: hypothetical protein ACKO5Q_08425 [Microcystaceae cyanobacterium]